jgi:hypothetical protein
MKLRLAVLGVCAAAGSLLYPGAAGAATVRPSAITCGMAVSTSITLTHDLNCPGTALSVQNNGSGPISITVDLGGHTVSSVSGAAIEARDGSVTMTLQNGRVVGRNGAASVEDEGSSDVYTRLTFDRGGIISVNDSSPRIFYCGFVHGAFVNAGENSIDIEHNIFSGSGATPNSSSVPGGAIGLSLTYSTVVENFITGYGTGITVSEDLGRADLRGNVLLRNGVGIRIVGPELPATLKNNVVIASRGDGIVIGDGTNSDVTGNTTLLNGGDGIRIDPTPAVRGSQALGIIARLSRNVSLANVGWGIEAPPASATIAVIDGGGNFVHFNGAGQCRNIRCH